MLAVLSDSAGRIVSGSFFTTGVARDVLGLQYTGAVVIGYRLAESKRPEACTQAEKNYRACGCTAYL